jgi:hypothetical protein
MARRYLNLNAAARSALEAERATCEVTVTVGDDVMAEFLRRSREIGGTNF